MATFRQIIPASGNTTYGDAQTNVIEPVTTEDIIKRRATTACLACKRRKIKCSGRPLPCDPCRIDKLECVLDLSLDGRRKASVKRIQEELEAHKTALRQLLHLVSEPSGQQLQAILPLIQRRLSFQELAIHLQAATADHGIGLGQPYYRSNSEDAVTNELPQDFSRQQQPQRVIPNSLDTDVVLHEGHHSGLVSILKTAPEDEALRLLRDLRTSDHQEQSLPRTGAISMFQHTTPTQAAGPTLISIRPGDESGSSSSFESNLTECSGRSPPGNSSSLDTSFEMAADGQPASLYCECQRLANRVQRLPALFGAFAEELDDHIACATAFYGWEFVRNNVVLDPQWEQIRLWDDRVLGMLNCHDSQVLMVDRLANLRLVRRVAKWLAGPDREAEEVKQSMPDFLFPTPSQQKTEIHELVHYMPWPGVRNLMIQHPSRYQTDDFWRGYLQSFHLEWPFDPVFLYDTTSTLGMFKIAEQFNQRFFNLDCWRLEKDFLDAYPELRPFAREYKP